jgi:paraquat-inducible protein A
MSHPRHTLSKDVAHPQARDLGLIVCQQCGSVWAQAQDKQTCERCGGRLHARQHGGLSAAWACWWGAVLLYLPANLLPVMITRSLFSQHSDTIMSGVVYFWAHGAYGLAAIVFVASFLVPLFKLAALFVLLRAARRPTLRRARELTKLYHLVEMVGRWSMLDVFVVAILAGLVHIQGMADVSAGVGIGAFGGVVVLTMLSSLNFDPRYLWDEGMKQEQAHDRANT